MPVQLSVFIKMLMDRHNFKGSDGPERDCLLFMTFGLFFRADDESEVKFSSSPFSFYENKYLQEYKESGFPERDRVLYVTFRVFLALITNQR